MKGSSGLRRARESHLPRISMIMPVKDGAKHIRSAIDSFRAQSWPEKELVVVDGFSRDASRSIVESYSDPTISLFQRNDSSATEALNFGKKVISGNVVGLLMSDDWLEDGALEAIGGAFRDNQDLQILNGGIRLTNEAGERGLLPDAVIGAAELGLGLEQILGTPYAAAFFFRRAVWDRLEGFDERYRYGADRDFLMRCRLDGLRSTNINSIVYNYRCHDGSDTFVDKDRIVRAFLRDHLDMSDRWLKAGKVSPADRRIILAWRRHQAFELAARILRVDGIFAACMFAQRQCLRDPLFGFTAMAAAAVIVHRKLSSAPS